MEPRLNMAASKANTAPPRMMEEQQLSRSASSRGSPQLVLRFVFPQPLSPGAKTILQRIADGETQRKRSLALAGDGVDHGQKRSACEAGFDDGASAKSANVSVEESLNDILHGYRQAIAERDEARTELQREKRRAQDLQAKLGHQKKVKEGMYGKADKLVRELREARALASSSQSESESMSQELEELRQAQTLIQIKTSALEREVAQMKRLLGNREAPINVEEG